MNKGAPIILGIIVALFASFMIVGNLPVTVEDFEGDLTIDGNLNVTGKGEFGGDVDMNLNYILYSINEKALHFDTVGGATRDHVSHLQVGSTTQDRRIMKLIVCVSPAPGVDKWVNISVSDGTNFMWMNITGATEDDYTTTGAFDLDVSAENLEILHDQTAGGASVHVNVIVQWYYKENE